MSRPSALLKHPLAKPALLAALGLAIVAAFAAALWPRPVPIDSAPRTMVRNL